MNLAIMLLSSLWIAESFADQPTRFQHMEEVKKCEICHAHRSRPHEMVTLEGAKIPRDEPQKLCMQCHARVGADWERGIHGKTTGGWRGQGRKLQCLECHDPHIPKRPPVVAEPHHEEIRRSHERTQ